MDQCNITHQAVFFFFFFLVLRLTGLQLLTLAIKPSGRSATAFPIPRPPTPLELVAEALRIPVKGFN